jgi:hypothetical protein
MNSLIKKILVAATCCGFSLGQVSARTGGVDTPFGKNQLGLQGPCPTSDIWQFLNILKLAGSVTTFATTPALAFARWSGGVATFTTVNNHSFYAGSSQSGRIVQIQNVSEFPGYNGNFSGATACTISGAKAFTCPITSNPGGSSSLSGNASFTLAISYPPNTPNSADGQSNNVYQYFDANGDTGANSQILRGSSDPPAAAQPVTVSWVANRNASGGTAAVGLQQSAGGIWLSYFSSNSVFINSGNTVGPVTASDAAWHSIQGVFTTSPNSVISADSTETTGNAGTFGILNSPFYFGSGSAGTDPYDGELPELGIDTTPHGGTTRTNMCHNQFQYWATAVSC